MITHTKETMADLIGKQFQNLTIRELEFRPHATSGYRLLYAYCECICGNFKWFLAIRVTSKSVKSCGCALITSNKSKKLDSFKEINTAWFNNIKRQALIRDIDFQITIEDVWKIWEEQNFRCALTGESLTWPYRYNDKRQTFRVGDASIDRIDSLKNYTIDNIQIIHKDINGMKLNHTQEEFIEFCNKVAIFNR